MMDDIVLHKIESIERCVKQVRHYYHTREAIPFENDYRTQDAIALNIQRAVEQAIDLANHIVKTKKLGIPKESSESIGLLHQAQLISLEQQAILSKMIGFRNLLVHEYTRLNLDIVVAFIENHLDDLLEFCSTILAQD